MIQVYPFNLFSLKCSLGRVATTADVWSRENLDSHLGVTAHYLARLPSSGEIVLKSELIAFRKLDGAHSGVNMGKVFVQILKEVEILHKVCAYSLF